VNPPEAAMRLPRLLPLCALLTPALAEEAAQTVTVKVRGVYLYTPPSPGPGSAGKVTYEAMKTHVKKLVPEDNPVLLPRGTWVIHFENAKRTVYFLNGPDKDNLVGSVSTRSGSLSKEVLADGTITF
jgi:hypothetical protein